MSAIGLFGGRGRMGQAIAAELARRGLALAGAADQGDALAPVASAASVLIDFSVPAALAEHLQAAVAAKRPIVVGTTGLGAAEHAALDAAARHVAVLQAANTSLGVTLLARLVREAAARLPDWDIELVEMHHRHKVDAPSGTALLLGAAAADGRRVALEDVAVHDRNGARGAGDIGFASLRGGSVAGDHMVVLAGVGERIELGHRAESREIFARGAVDAALWLETQPPGRYRMDDVLGLA